MGKRFIFFLTSIVCILLLTGFSVVKIKKQSSHPLVFGTNAAYYPFEFQNDQGEVIGFDIDMAKEIAKKLKRPMELRLLPFDALLRALEDRRVDIVMNCVSITPERQRKYELIPYIKAPTHYYMLGFWENIPDHITTLEDVKNAQLTIGVKSISEEEDFLNSVGGLRVRPKASEAEVVNDMRFKRVDSGFWEPINGMYIKIQNPEIKLIKVPLSKDKWIDYYGLVINKENKELIEEVSKALKELREEGTFGTLEKKWLSDKNPEDFLEKK